MILWSMVSKLGKNQKLYPKRYNVFVLFQGNFPTGKNQVFLFSANVNQQRKHDIKSLFPVPDMDHSFIHLGHPLILPAKDRSIAYNFVYEKIKSKLTTYKANR